MQAAFGKLKVVPDEGKNKRIRRPEKMMNMVAVTVEFAQAGDGDEIC